MINLLKSYHTLNNDRIIKESNENMFFALFSRVYHASKRNSTILIRSLVMQNCFLVLQNLEGYFSVV